MQGMQSYILLETNLSLVIKPERPCLNPEKQSLAILGVRAFYVATVSHLQSRLPLRNKLLRELGCLNPLKRHRKSTNSFIQNLSSKKLQPQLDVTSVLDKWKLLQADQEVSELHTNQRVDHVPAKVN